MLGASLAITIEHPPVTSLHDILQSPYKLQVGKGSSIATMFLNASKNTVHRQIVDADKLIYNIPNERDVFKRMVNGSLPHNTLFFGVYQPIRLLPEWSCNVASVNVDYRKVSNGLIFQKNWRYTEIFNYHIIRLKDEGIIDGIRKKYYVQGDTVCDRIPIKPATLTETMTLYILIAAGLIVSFLFYTCEYLYFYHYLDKKVEIVELPENGNAGSNLDRKEEIGDALEDKEASLNLTLELESVEIHENNETNSN